MPVAPAPTSSAAVIATLKWARKQNFKPVPIRPKSKASTIENYTDLKYNPPSDDLWVSKELGVGIVTGPRHSGPVDVDIDCAEAAFFASKFLPPSGAVFGRKTKPRSHYLYRSEGEDFPKAALVDPIAKATIIELRGDGGHQTVFPGSIHEDTGELIEWADTPFPDVPRVNEDLLEKAVKKVAIAVMVVRHMWQPGQRNEVCKNLAGLFYYLDWPQDETLSLIEAVMEYTEDDDRTRLKTVAATYRKGERGGKITGSNSMRTLLADGRAVDKILEWAGNTTASILQDYNERFAIVNVRGKFRIAETADLQPGEPPILYAKDDFLNMMEADTLSVDDKKVPKARVWLANPKRRTYRSMDFIPGVEDSYPVLNTWTGWSVQPDPKGSCRAWLDLLYYIICGRDDTTYQWMLSWFAHIVREPRDKVPTCPVLVGRQGAGKSLLVSYFGRIIGQNYTVITNDEHLFGRFNKHLSTTLLLHSEEALYGGEKKHRGIIKSLISDNRRMTEQKGVDAENTSNLVRLIISSNESHAAPSEIGDRRFTVLDLEGRKIENPGPVVEEMNTNGPAALFNHLLNEIEYDRTAIRSNLKNEALNRMKQVNFDPMASWWYDTLMHGQVLPDYLSWAKTPILDPWPQVVSSKALYVSFMLRCRERGMRYIPTESLLATHLAKMMGVKLDRVQRRFINPRSETAPKEVQQMDSKQYAVLNMPILADARKGFEMFLGQGVDWPRAEVDEPTKDKF